MLLPTGTGQPRNLPSGNFSQFGSVVWLPDSHRFVFGANEPGPRRRLCLQDIDGGAPRAISPPGAKVQGFGLSADGKSVYVGGPDGKPNSFPVEGGPLTPAFRNIDLGDLQPIRLSGDGRFIFARDSGRISVGIFRIDLASGHKDLLREVSPGDPAGLQSIGNIRLSADGRFYVYGYTRALGDLYAVEGLK
jgi:hypothetical protein